MLCRIATVSLLLLFTTPCIAAEKIKIGAVASLTGAAAENGKSWLEGAQLATSALAKEGIPVELIVEDDATVPARAVSSFLKLATQNKVSGVVGGTWDFLAESMYSSAERLKIPLITPTNPVEVLSTSALNNRWIFTNGLSVSASVEAVKKLWTGNRPRSLGFIVIQVPYGLVQTERLKIVAKDMDIPVEFTKEITYQGFADEIKLGALESKRFNVDTIFVVLDRTGIDILFRQLDLLAFSPKVLMTQSLKDAFELSSSKGLYKNALGIFQTESDADFARRFFDKYGRLPGEFAANGYDATICLARAISRNEFKNETLKYICNGVTGAHHFSDKKRDLVETKAGVFAISENGLKRVS